MRPIDASLKVGLCFVGAVLAVSVVIALWPEHTVVAWVVFVLFVVGTVVLLALHTLDRLTHNQDTSEERHHEMLIRHTRYHHAEETPLDPQGYPTHLQSGEHPYPKRGAYAHDYD